MIDPTTKTIRGIVIPTDWHDNGHPRSVAIATYREQKYLVAESPKCRQLLTLLNERVVVSGVIRRVAGNMVIEIGDFYLTFCKLIEEDLTPPAYRGWRPVTI